MKLRNNKEYNLFSWPRCIYNAQLKISSALLTPIQSLKFYQLDRSSHFLELKPAHRSIHFQRGLSSKFIIKKNNKYLLNISLPYASNNQIESFLQIIEHELKKISIKSSLLYSN